MDAATAQLIVSSVLRVLDLVSRVAEKKFDSREELEAYIAERNALRKQLVELAQQATEEEPEDDEEIEARESADFLRATEEDEDATEAAPQSE